MNAEKLLLHCCCAPCAAVPLIKLQNKFKVSFYFYNPNIYPPEEYQKRFLEIKKYTDKLQVDLTQGDFEQQRWQTAITGWENMPEGGARCEKCYQLRLEQTAQYAKDNNISWFSSTLSLSPHKSAEKINKIGQELAQQYNLKFYTADFKKEDGFKKSLEISKAEGFYRQNYCGCQYSQRRD
ncbi:MAG: epoxyqueuosine reductase QueH [Candidatus Margulisbacteria bacterium]|nr:epoxyqueuosine reductase QueH [Candidatus Margulisiibacteriota bacterium]